MSRCETPEKFRTEAEWMHNPYKDWNYIVANIAYGRQGVCIAYPPSTIVKGCTFYESPPIVRYQQP